jgi:hypothetical protein
MLVHRVGGDAGHAQAPEAGQPAGLSGTRLSTMPKWSRYAASSASSVSRCRSVRVSPWVWMSVRPLMETRLPGVSLEQIVLRVKCDSGEVCCHQHVGTQSVSDRSRVSIRYWGRLSFRTSMSPAPASASRNRPAGSSWSSLASSSSG